MRYFATNRLLFNASAAIYLIYRSYRLSSGNTTIDLIDAHLADLLALPVILAITEDILARFKGVDFRLNRRMIFFAWVYTSFTMEWLAPRYYAENAVADYYDVFAYGVGAILFTLYGRGFSLLIGVDDHRL